MSWNLNHGWGKLVAESLKSKARTGKVLVVCPTTHGNWEELNEILPANDKIRVVTTLQAAADLCTASEDDVIFLVDGHSETVTAAAGLSFTKAGVSIVGLGKGDRRPTINFTTATTADLDVDGEGISFENLIFDLTGVDALAGPLDINADNALFKDCEFITANASGQAVVGLVTAVGVDGLTLDNCFARGSKDAGNTSFVRLIGGERHSFKNSTFDGAYRVAAGAIEATSVASSFKIENCNIRNKTAASTAVVNVIRNSTAIIAGCVFGILSGSTPVQIEYQAGGFVGGGGNLLMGRNYYKAGTTPIAGTLL